MFIRGESVVLVMDPSHDISLRGCVLPISSFSLSWSVTFDYDSDYELEFEPHGWVGYCIKDEIAQPAPHYVAGSPFDLLPSVVRSGLLAMTGRVSPRVGEEF
jgi:hypothetical protein